MTDKQELAAYVAAKLAADACRCGYFRPAGVSWRLHSEACQMFVAAKAVMLAGKWAADWCARVPVGADPQASDACDRDAAR